MKSISVSHTCRGCMTIIFFMFCMQIFAWNRRHIIILQDNSGSFYSVYNEQLIKNLQKHICDLFQNQKIGDTYCILNSEIDKGEVFYNPQTDIVSFYWFAADQYDNITFYNSNNKTPTHFEKLFFKKGVTQFDGSKEINKYLQENFKYRPELKSHSNSLGISTYSFSAYAYPLCMDILKNSYAEEYIVLIISDFNAGSTFGNRNDEKIIREAFKGKAQKVVDRVNELNSKLFKIEYFDYYKTTKHQGLIGFIGYKIRPNIGSHSPENVDLYINSNIELCQRAHKSDSYRIKKAEVVFDHNEKVELDKVFLWVKFKDTKQISTVDVTNNIVYDSILHKYIFRDIDITLSSKAEPSQNFDGELKFLFYIKYDTGSENNIKFIYEIGRDIDATNIHFRTKLSNTQIFMIVVLCSLLLAIAVLWFLHQQGKPTGITLHWNHFNDNYETVDFSTDGVGRVLTDYHAWNPNDFERGISIKVEGKFVYNHVGRFYNWHEQTGFPVRITPSLLEYPQGYTMYLTAENKVTNNSNIPIVTDMFEDGRFSFKVMIKKDDYSPVEMPLPFKFQIEVAGRSVGFFRKFFYTRNIAYSFHVGPELGDVWVGVDPGTTGSCIATATEPDDMTIEKTNDGKDKITPSVIVIKTEQLQDSKEDSIRRQAMYGIDAERQRESEKYRKFVSIKKLLGYNESFVLKKIGKSDVSVKSSFLSTLLIEGLFNQHKKYLESRPQEFEQFFNSGSYAPRRAVFAIPNNFTASKIQHLKSCIQASTLTSLKDIRFIYEAEAILVNYIHGKESDLQTSSLGENIFIFDMGGATINATLANIKKRGNNYEISILAKLGYGIGGDTIDYAFLKWIYSKSKIYSSLAENNPFEGGGMSMSKRREYKDNILTLKKQLIANYSSGSKNKLLDRSDIARYFGAALIEDAEGDYSKDVFEKEIQKNSSSFLYGKAFEEYVWTNIESIVNDILVVCKEKGIDTLDTVIMSGRSSHFPRVEEKVKNVVKATFDKAEIKLLGLEESKSAVAKGACYYGVENAKIKLQNRSVNGVFGVIQTLSPNAAPIFHRLIDDGAVFQDGVATGSSPIKQEQDFVWNGRKVRFCQVMGVDAEKVIANREKHKYTEIATIKAQPYAVKGVQISVTEKDKVICSITDVNGDIQRPVEGVVNDADIVACNDEQYTFFIK